MSDSQRTSEEDPFVGAEQMLGVPLQEYKPAAKTLRDEYLSKTLVGKYLVDLFYANEERIVQRHRRRSLHRVRRVYRSSDVRFGWT